MKKIFVSHVIRDKNRTLEQNVSSGITKVLYQKTWRKSSIDDGVMQKGHDVLSDDNKTRHGEK